MCVCVYNLAWGFFYHGEENKFQLHETGNEDEGEGALMFEVCFMVTIRGVGFTILSL